MRIPDPSLPSREVGKVPRPKTSRFRPRRAYDEFDVEAGNLAVRLSIESAQEKITVAGEIPGRALGRRSHPTGKDPRPKARPFG